MPGTLKVQHEIHIDMTVTNALTTSPLPLDECQNLTDKSFKAERRGGQIP
jgi:hypothetical protein